MGEIIVSVRLELKVHMCVVRIRRSTLCAHSVVGTQRWKHIYVRCMAKANQYLCTLFSFSGFPSSCAVSSIHIEPTGTRHRQTVINSWLKRWAKRNDQKHIISPLSSSWYSSFGVCVSHAPLTAAYRCVGLALSNEMRLQCSQNLTQNLQVQRAQKESPESDESEETIEFSTLAVTRALARSLCFSQAQTYSGELIKS